MMSGEETGKPLKPETIEKTEQATLLVETALMNFDNPVIMWTGGKDSNLMLWFVRRACSDNEWKLPPAIVIDHGLHFEETWAFLHSVSSQWDVDLIKVSNPDLLSGKLTPGTECLVENLSEINRSELRRLGHEEASISCSLDNIPGNHLLKTVVLNMAIRKGSFDAIFVGIRRDENPARAHELYFSERKDPDHVRVHPLLDFHEHEVWEVTLHHKLPIHPLYSVGYRSLDGTLDSERRENIPAWEQDFEISHERAGRAQDKEEIMDRLRSLGYF